jgi:uncharacterized repeat protein (TIGR01451 family)
MRNKISIVFLVSAFLSALLRAPCRGPAAQTGVRYIDLEHCPQCGGLLTIIPGMLSSSHDETLISKGLTMNSVDLKLSRRIQNLFSLPVMLTLALLVLVPAPAGAASFAGTQTGPTEWTYTLTFDPLDNYAVCPPPGDVATITLSGLAGVVAATPPTSTDFPPDSLPASVNLLWMPQVSNGGTVVAWTHQGGGTGNFDIPKHAFGLKVITEAPAVNGTVNVASDGFSFDGPCPIQPADDRDFTGTTNGPVGSNLPPTASNVLITGTAEIGQVLTASYDYADAENDPQGASTFRWLHTDGEVDTPIDGATALAYTLVAADEGALIKFEVTPVAQSGISPGLAASAVVGPVVGPVPVPNVPPTASNVLISGTPQVGQVLTGSYTYADAEGDLQGASIFRWLRDNVAIAGATARSYALVAADEGTLISFEITPVALSGPSPGLAVTSAEVGSVTPAPNDRQTASDLELISLKATPELLTVNGQLTYTITVRNNGPAAATGVHVIDALPPAATPVPAGAPADSSQGRCTSTPSSGPQPQALTVDCDLGTLAPSAEATVTINVMPTVPGDLINTAQVAALEHDPIPANNSSTQTTTVRAPDPAEADLAITAAVGPRASGQGFTYTLTVTNHGPATATGVQLTNDLPRGFNQITASQGSCSVTDPMLCALGELTSGVAETVTINVIPEVNRDTLPNRAAVNGDQRDPNTANNFALTSALELPTSQTACDSKRCRLKITCNRSDLLESKCQNKVTLFVDKHARRLSDKRAASGPRLVPFAATVSNLPGDKTQNVRLKLTPKGKKLAGKLIRQGMKKLRGVMKISNYAGGGGIDIIHLTVRLK